MMRTTAKRSTSRRLALAVAVSLAVAACGGATDDTDDATASDAVEDGDQADTEDPDDDGGEEAAEEFEPRTLNYVSFVSQENPHMIAADRWMSEITDRTGGAITFDAFYSEALCAAPDITACIRDGRADVGFTTAGYTPSEFPVAMVGSVPFQTANLTANVNAFRRLYDEGGPLRDEFERLGQHVLHFGAVGLPLLALSTDVTSLDDLEGLSVRSIGSMGPALEDLGMNPVAVAPAEQYESLQRGVIDGSAFTLDGHAEFRHFEVVDRFYDLGEHTGSYTLMHTPINLEVWESLEPGVQDIMTEVSQETANAVAEEIYPTADERDCGTLLENGAEVVPLPDGEQLEEWIATWSDQLLEDWAAGASEAGVDDPMAVAQRLQELIAEEEAANPDYRSAANICMGMAEG